MRWVLVIATWCGLLISPFVAVMRLVACDISRNDWQVFIEHGIITTQFVQCVSISVILFAWALTIVTLIQGVRLRRNIWHSADPSSLLSMCGIALASFLSLGTGSTTDESNSDVHGVDVRVVAAPVMAGLAAAHTVRKLQSDSKIEVESLIEERVNDESDTSTGVAVLVDRTPRDINWEAVVRVYGYPCVENREGRTIDFRKRKALELLTWLSINRDRPFRSAARTAMWESNVSDSTFATVVSDMRRGLSELSPHVSPREWAPPTFTDDIVLSDTVVTDVELLSRAWDQFQRDRTMLFAVVSELSHVRDLPFAGAGYLWPDVDGTTTRFVILGANIAREIAYWSYDHKEWDALTTAVTAGLRLLPGDEELLDLQRLVLQSSHRGLD
jgi:hypothetical protein